MAVMCFSKSSSTILLSITYLYKALLALFFSSLPRYLTILIKCHQILLHCSTSIFYCFDNFISTSVKSRMLKLYLSTSPLAFSFCPLCVYFSRFTLHNLFYPLQRFYNCQLEKLSFLSCQTRNCC